MEFQDYYATLGVAKTASEKEIRSAFRKLARQHHPDVNPNDKAAEEQFKKVSEAYEVLSDPDKRKKYDEVGAHWKEYEQWSKAREAAGQDASTSDWSRFTQAPPGGQRYTYSTAREDDLRDMFGEGGRFSDFFENIFAGGGYRTERGGTPRPMQGQSVEALVSVTLAEAYQGAKRLVSIPAAEGEKRIEVSIPAGVEDGTRIRVAGQGGPGLRGGPAGDLYLIVQVQPDTRFERNGLELRTKVTAPFSTAILGGETAVTLPGGRRLALKVPAGTSDGKSFRLRGQGMPALSSGSRGDLVVELHVSLPEHPTARQKELLEELARIELDSEVGVGAA